MKKGLFKKIAIGTISVLLLFSSVLCVHIYMVTRPKAPDEHTLVMARVDLKQSISAKDGNNITGWLYQQKGVDHVLCNIQSRIVVFTYYPVKADANEVVARLKSNFNLDKATRYMPSEAELKSSCPVAANSFSYKAYKFITHIF